MTPEQILLTKIIIFNPNQRKMANKRKTSPVTERGGANRRDRGGANRLTWAGLTD